MRNPENGYFIKSYRKSDEFIVPMNKCNLLCPLKLSYTCNLFMMVNANEASLVIY